MTTATIWLYIAFTLWVIVFAHVGWYLGSSVPINLQKESSSTRLRGCCPSTMSSHTACVICSCRVLLSGRSGATMVVKRACFVCFCAGVLELSLTPCCLRWACRFVVWPVEQKCVCLNLCVASINVSYLMSYFFISFSVNFFTFNHSIYNYNHISLHINYQLITGYRYCFEYINCVL